jgi:hypothetical protein
MAPLNAKTASNLWGIQFDEESHLGRDSKTRRERWMREVTEFLRGTDPSKPGGMAANPVAQVILGHIAASPHTLTFTTATVRCNAAAALDPDAYDQQDDAHPEGLTYLPLGPKDDPKTKIDERKVRSRTKGTGKGMDARIEFTPGVSADCKGGAIFEPDDMVLHEMVHALRIIQGQDFRTDLDGVLAHYDDDEEWLAILIESIYRSAKGRTVFRSGHTHARINTPLAHPLNTSAGFLTVAEHRRLMWHYHSTWWPVFRDLSRVTKAEFNPIREFERDPLKYP